MTKKIACYICKKEVLEGETLKHWTYPQILGLRRCKACKHGYVKK